MVLNKSTVIFTILLFFNSSLYSYIRTNSFFVDFGNTFTHECIFTGGDLASHPADGFVYNHHSGTLTTPVCTTTTITVPPGCLFVSYDKSTACPSRLGGGGSAGDIQLRIANFTEQATVLKAHYNSVLDGGNTQARLQTIATKPAGQIKDELLLYSPYLSDTVLLAYLAKPNKGKGHVPVGHIKEVIVANSPVTKEVKAVVDSKGLPSGIQNEINAVQTGISPRVELEQQIAYFEMQVAITRNELTRFYLNDTTLTAPLDSAIEVLKNSGTQTAEILLASAYIAKGDFTEARQQLNSLSLVPKLDNYVQIQNLVIDIFEAGAGFDTLITDSMLKQTVESIAADSLKAGYLIARAIMTGVFGIIYHEPIEILQLQSAKKGFDDNNTPGAGEEIKDVTIKEVKLPDNGDEIIVYPNPASDKLFVKYSLTSTHDAIIKIYDIIGKIHEYHLPGESGITEIDLAEQSSGLYYYFIIVNNNTIARDKIVLIK